MHIYIYPNMRQVTALLALSEGAQFLSNGLLYVTERLRLGPHGATSLVVRLLVTTPGLKNMTGKKNKYSRPQQRKKLRPHTVLLHFCIYFFQVRYSTLHLFLKFLSPSLFLPHNFNRVVEIALVEWELARDISLKIPLLKLQSRIYPHED